MEAPYCVLCFHEIKLPPGKLPICSDCFNEVSSKQSPIRMDILLKAHRSIEMMRTRKALENLLSEIRSAIEDGRKGMGAWGTN